jgi:hypothetical protein
MRLFEFADAKASLELWNIVNDCVWKAISVQAQEQERLEQEQAIKQKKKPNAAPKLKLPPKPTIVALNHQKLRRLQRKRYKVRKSNLRHLNPSLRLFCHQVVVLLVLKLKTLSRVDLRSVLLTIPTQLQVFSDN